jgi:RNA polymerase sigma factor (sigma-70 family)
MQRDAERQARVETLLERHLPGLKGFLRHRAPDLVLEKESADDLAQSVCRDVLEHLEDGRLELLGDSGFKQWLYEAALWKLRSRTRHLRAQRRDAARERRLPASDSALPGVARPAISETPSRLVASAEERAAVRAAIDELGGRDAEVLRLVVLEERSHRDAAEQLGVSEANSRMLLSRALAKLAGRLQR